MFGRFFDVLTGSLPGRPERTFVADVATPDRAAPDPDALRRLVAAMHEVPGVAHVAIANGEPQPAAPGGIAIEALDAPAGAPSAVGPTSRPSPASTSTRSRCRSGPAACSQGWESPAAPHVAVVSETMARRCWGSADAVGRRLRFARFDDAPWLVVGVVTDVAGETRIRPRPAELYLPFAQAPRGDAGPARGDPHGGGHDRTARGVAPGRRAPSSKPGRGSATRLSWARLLPNVLQALSAMSRCCWRCSACPRRNLAVARAGVARPRR